MTITRNMTVEAHNEGRAIVVEIYDHLDMVDTFRVTNWCDHPLNLVEHMLTIRGYTRQEPMPKMTDEGITFKVDHYEK